MRGNERGLIKKESGEVMLESSIVLVAVMILVMALISISFLFYQKSMMMSIAAEVASDVAKNYKFADLAVSSNTISIENVEAQPIYRMTLGRGTVEDAQIDRVEDYLDERIALSSLGFNSGEPEVVRCDITYSGVGRAYVTVTIRQKSDFFLSGILELLNIWGEDGAFSATATAECLDMTGYTSNVNFVDYCAGKLSALESVGDIYVNIKDIAQKLLD